MKKLLLALALLLAPSAALAQCNGVFPNNTVCGNITGANNTPRPTNPSAFLGAAGGTNGQIQYNNGGALGGFTASGGATINISTGVVTLALIANSTSVTGASTTYTTAQNNTMIERSNSGAPMIDTLPGTSPGILPAGSFITIKNNDTSVLAINVGAGASMKAQTAPTGYVYLCPGQAISWYSDGSIYWSTGQPATCYLKAATTFYAAATGGSATNHGLTSAAPLDNIPDAYALAQSVFNAGLLNPTTQAVTIQAADGTYGSTYIWNKIPGQAAEDAQQPQYPVILQGNLSTPTNANISGGANSAMQIEGDASTLVQGFSFTSTGGNGLVANGAKIAQRNNNFAANSINSMIATHRGMIEIAGNYTISGGGQGHWLVSDGGSLYVQVATAVNLTSSSTFTTCFACAQYPSSIVLNVVPTFTGAGTFGATVKFSAFLNGVINTGGQGINFFPGSGAGSTSTGGQYN